MRRSIFITIVSFLVSFILFPIHVQAAKDISVYPQCTGEHHVEICILVPNKDQVDGFEIYRYDKDKQTYELAFVMDLFTNGYYDYMNDAGWTHYNNTDEFLYIYEDVDSVYEVGETFEYKVNAFLYSDKYKKNVDSISATKAAQYRTVTNQYVIKSAMAADAPTINSAKRSGKLNVKLTWTPTENVDGYRIFYVKNYTNKSKPKFVNKYDLSSYSVAMDIQDPAACSATIKSLMNGVTYTYRICSYKIIDGNKVCSLMSEPKSVLMDYYSYEGESYKKKVKRAFGSEKKKKKNFKSSSKAAKQMKTIKIKVWDFKNGKKGKKITRTKYITVNKKLAPSIKAMFDEIYKSKEKQVIKDIGCYSYRTGEHMYGLAIDINPNENYMVDGGTVLAGSFWNPKKSKYSIPLNCETVRIMQRYGFYRGFWGDRKDYMHFSYFGT